jgi:hypothetical protein
LRTDWLQFPVRRRFGLRCSLLLGGRWTPIQQQIPGGSPAQGNPQVVRPTENLFGTSVRSVFPTTAGAFDATANGAFDRTLTKLNAAGSALVYSTYFGGNDFDGGAGLVVDSAGHAYVAGSTPSANFPTTPGAYDTTFNNGDAFLAKFNATGSALVFSTFVGGSDYDSFSAVVLDTAGNAWLTGGTNSADFPITAGAPDSTFNGGGDAIIVELNSTGSALLFSTFLGHP